MKPFFTLLFLLISFGIFSQSEKVKDSTSLTSHAGSKISTKTLEYKAHPRPDTTVLVVNKIVGESIELNEKTKFDLFKIIDNSPFAYALYLSVKGKVLIEVKYNDGSTTYLPYTIEELMNDAQKIDKIQITNQSSASTPVINPQRRLHLKVKKWETKKSDTFNEGHHFYYTTHNKIEGLLPVIGRVYTYDDQYMMYAKLIKVLNHGEQAIEIEKDVSGLAKVREIVQLSDIVEISKTLSSTRFKVNEDSVLFIENY